LRRILPGPRRLARSLSVALFAVVAVTFAVACELPPTHWRAADTAVGEVLQYSVGDGRMTYVDTNSQIHVNVTDAQTQIVVNRGGALITGQGDRPLQVVVAGLTVRSEHGEFSVRRQGSAAVDLLVARDSVRIARTGARLAQWSWAFPGAAWLLSAGEAAHVDAAGVAATQRLSPEAVAHKLAWKDGWLWFSDETLAQAIERFNEYNTHRKLILADPRLEHLTVGGRFRPSEPDSFVAALKQIFRVQVQTRPTGSRDAGAIYVSASCRRGRRMRCDTPFGQ
jgi:transmembrane sensor